jgi:hypothetical protein
VHFQQHFSKAVGAQCMVLPQRLPTWKFVLETSARK